MTSRSDATSAPILSADEIWSQGFSEPEAGSDLASLRTSAVETDAGWVLNGQKTWISWGQFSRWCGVLARTDPDVPRHKGISLFILDMESPGIDLRPMVQITGHAEFCEMFLDDVVVPKENMLGERGQGWKIAMHVVAHERGTAAVARQVTLRDVVRQAGHRYRFDARRRRAAPRRRQSAGRVGAALVEIEALRHHASRTMSPFLNGDPVGPESSTVKLLLAKAEQTLGETALELLGDAGERRLLAGALPLLTRRDPSTAVPGRSSARSSPTGSSPFPRSDMELQLTDEQELLAESIRELVGRGPARTASSPRKRANRSGGSCVDFGVLEIGPSEAELGTVDLALVARALGERLAAVPLVDTAALLLGAGAELDGTDVSSAALGLAEHERSFAPTRPSTMLEGDRVSGSKTSVVLADTSALLALPAGTTDGAVLALVRPDAPGVELELEPTLDPSLRPATVRLDGAAPERVLGSTSSVDQVAATAAVLAAAEAVGAAASRPGSRARLRGRAPPVRPHDRELPGCPPHARRHGRPDRELVVERPLRGRLARRGGARQPPDRRGRQGVDVARDARRGARGAAGVRRRRVHRRAPRTPLSPPHRIRSARDTARPPTTSASSADPSPASWRSRHEQRHVPARVPRARSTRPRSTSCRCSRPISPSTVLWNDDEGAKEFSGGLEEFHGYLAQRDPDGHLHHVVGSSRTGSLEVVLGHTTRHGEPLGTFTMVAQVDAEGRAERMFAARTSSLPLAWPA